MFKSQLTVLILILLSGARFLAGQDIIEFFQPQEHFSNDGKSKITLIFVSLNGSRVKVISPEGKEVENDLKNFSRESQTWFKVAEKVRKKYISRVEAFQKKLGYLDESPAHRRFFYKALAVNQDLGWLAEKPLLSLAYSTEESIEERYNAICAFGSVARVTDENYKILYAIAASAKQPLHYAVNAVPENFLSSFGRFETKAEPYLIHVACTGILPLPEQKKGDKKITLATKPVMLATTSGPKNRIRAAAILGMAQPKASTKVLPLMYSLLTQAMKKINGQQDAMTIRAVLLGVGQMGKSSKSISGRFKTLEKSFSNEVALAESRLKAAAEQRKVEQKLKKLRNPIVAKSPMNRIFRDVSGREIVYGRFRNYVDEYALFTNHANELIRVPKNSLSPADLKWIDQKKK